MRTHIPSALVFILAVALAGCDAVGEDPEEELFNGSWNVIEVESKNTDYTSIVLAPYTSAIFSFVARNDDLIIYLDVTDSPDDIQIFGSFDVDSDDGELTLFSSAFPRAIDFNYVFENDERLILWTDDDSVLPAIFRINLDLDEVILVMDRD